MRIGEFSAGVGLDRKLKGEVSDAAEVWREHWILMVRLGRRAESAKQPEACWRLKVLETENAESDAQREIDGIHRLEGIPVKSDPKVINGDVNQV